jgi:hypothetical protein
MLQKMLDFRGLGKMLDVPYSTFHARYSDLMQIFLNKVKGTVWEKVVQARTLPLYLDGLMRSFELLNDFAGRE